MKTDAHENCCCASHEPRLKSLWRKLLGAYWQHQNTKLPEEFVLSRGWNKAAMPICPFCNLGHRVKHSRDLSKGSHQCSCMENAYFTPEVRAKDAITVRCEVRLDWKDKLRLLLGCRLQINGIVYTEKLPGITKGDFHVFPIL